MARAPFLSIVVPIYNVERYLRKCLQSLQEVSDIDCEFILVDDGSTDKSGAIADTFAADDNRAIVIHQDNAGLGFARNAGLNRCRGRYIAFVDSDDWLDKGAYSEMLKIMEASDCDVCFGGYKTVSNGQITNVFTHPLAGRTLCFPEEIADIRATFYAAPGLIKGERYLPITAWCALYKRKFLDSYDLKFRNVFSEDVVFNIEVAGFAGCIGFASDTFYNYRKDNQPSIMTSANKNLWIRNEDPIAAACKAGEQDPYISEDELSLRIAVNTLTRVMSTLKSSVNSASGFPFFLSIVRSICESASYREGIRILRDDAMSSRMSISGKSRLTLRLISSSSPILLSALYFLMKIIG